MAEGMARTEVWAMGDLVTPMAIRVAATLRLADHMAAGATGVDDLAHRTSAHPDALGRLLGHLATVGVVARTGPGEYRLTEFGRALQDDHPSGNRSWLDLEGVVGRADLAFVRLLDTVRTGRAAYPAMFGRGFWDDLDADPALSASFDALMGHHPVVSDVLAGYGWGEVSHVVDVGGGNGTLLAALLLAHPHLRATLVERAGPAEAARSVLAKAGALDRCTVVAGSFFDPLPEGADVYILSRVLEDWDDEHAVAILRRCAAAAVPFGTVLLVEEGAPGQDDEDGKPIDTEMDLRMLVYCGGRERSLPELRALAAAAGLHVASTRRGRQSSLVELVAGAPAVSRDRPPGRSPDPSARPG